MRDGGVAAKAPKCSHASRRRPSDRTPLAGHLLQQANEVDRASGPIFNACASELEPNSKEGGE